MRTMLLAAVLLAGAAGAGEIEVEDARVVLPPGPPRSAAGYMTLRNAGAADRLLGVSADGVRAAVHETVEREGVATMTSVETLEVPAEDVLVFAPGGLHVMFTGFESRPEAGGTFEAVLTFEDAGDVPVSFVVETFGDR